MNARSIAVAAVVGTGLLYATVMQARTGVPTQVAQAAAPSRGPRVAAEGRVVTYPDAEVMVSAERTGRVTALRVIEGQKVKRGDVLAEIEAEELRAARAEAAARVAEADAEVKLAELSRARRQELVEQQIAAAHDLDQANRDLEIATARRETARAEVTRLDAQLRKSVVRAPISGSVITRHLDAGETIESGRPLVTIANLTRLRVEGEADEADAAALRVGGMVEITSDAYPGRHWKGRIEEVGDAASLRRLKPQDPGRPTDTRILPVKVALSEATPLKLGTTVELSIMK